jgi:hypothetical protein
MPRKKDSNKAKICRCHPYCLKLLKKRQIARHYAAARRTNPALIQDPLTPAESDMEEDEEEEDADAEMDIDPLPRVLERYQPTHRVLASIALILSESVLYHLAKTRTRTRGKG